MQQQDSRRYLPLIFKGQPVPQGYTRGARYYFRTTDGQGKRKWVPVPAQTDSEARQWILGELGKDKADRFVPTQTRFAEAAEEWLAGKTKLKPGSLRLYDSMLRLYLLDPFGRRKLSDIDKHAVRKLIVDLEKRGLSASTINSCLAVLSGIMRWAVWGQAIRTNPVSELLPEHRPQQPGRTVRIPSPEEAKAILAHSLSFKPLVATALFSGLRLGELLGLRWQDVDLKEGVIHVQHQLASPETGALATPKTKAGVRRVLIGSALVTVLRAHRQDQLAKGLVRSDDFVFTTRGGKFQFRRTVGITFAGTLLRSGVTGLRFHDLRHYFASSLIAAGADVMYLADQLGHENASLTHDVYLHLFKSPEREQRHREALDAAAAGML